MVTIIKHFGTLLLGLLCLSQSVTAAKNGFQDGAYCTKVGFETWTNNPNSCGVVFTYKPTLKMSQEERKDYYKNQDKKYKKVYKALKQRYKGASVYAFPTPDGVDFIAIRLHVQDNCYKFGVADEAGNVIIEPSYTSCWYCPSVKRGVEQIPVEVFWTWRIEYLEDLSKNMYRYTIEHLDEMINAFPPAIDNCGQLLTLLNAYDKLDSEHLFSAAAGDLRKKIDNSRKLYVQNAERLDKALLTLNERVTKYEQEQRESEATVSYTCPSCHGTKRCPMCNGIKVYTPFGGKSMPCSKCHQTGICQNCQGKGSYTLAGYQR